MIIEPATLADIPAITAIYGRSVLEEFASFELEPPSQAEMASRLQNLLGAGYPWLVARNASGIVTGYACCSAYRPRPAYGATVETTVYVDPQNWGTGVGSALLTGLIDHCRRADKRQMIAVIACEATANLSTLACVRLHQKHGFELAGRLTGIGFKHGKWLDTLLLQKPV